MKKILLTILIFVLYLSSNAQSPLRINKYLVDSLTGSGYWYLFKDTTHTGQWGRLSGGSGGGSGENISNTNLTFSINGVHDVNNKTVTFNNNKSWLWDFTADNLSTFEVVDTKGFFFENEGTSGGDFYNGWVDFDPSFAELYWSRQTVEGFLTMNSDVSESQMNVNLKSKRGSHQTNINLYNDSLYLDPYLGQMNIVSLRSHSDTTHRKPMTWNVDNGMWEYMTFWPSGGSGSGTVNTGAANKATYYPSAGTTVDDVTGVDFNTTNLLAKFTAQASTSVPVEIKGASSQSANYLNISSSSGTGDIFKLTSAGEILMNGVSDAGSYDIQATRGITVSSVASNTSGLFITPTAGVGQYFDISNSGGTTWNLGAGGGNTLSIFTSGGGSITFMPSITLAQTITTTGVALSLRLKKNQGADVASLNGAIAVGSDGNVFELTGTNSVTLISNLNWQNGSEITFVFTGAAVLTDGTANSGTDIGMELAGGVNFTGSAEDTLTLVLSEIGGTQRWREKCRSVN